MNHYARRSGFFPRVDWGSLIIISCFIVIDSHSTSKGKNNSYVLLTPTKLARAFVVIFFRK